MVAPAVREIIKRHPKAEFTLLTSPDGFKLFQHFDPRIVHFLINGTTPLTKRFRWIYQYFKIKKQNYDHTYCLDKDWKIRFLLAHSAPNFIAFEVPKNAGTVHGAVEMLQVVGVNLDRLSEIPIPFIPVDKTSLSEIKIILSNNGISENDILVGLNPSFSGLKRSKTRKYKFWSTQNWAILADELSQYGRAHKISIKVLIYSLPRDRQLGEEIISLCKYPPTLLVPESNLELFKAYLSRLDLYIGPDTGATHLAAGLGTELIALFSVTNPYGCGPVVHDIGNSVIRAEDKVAPNICLDLITPDDVLQLAKLKISKLVS